MMDNTLEEVEFDGSGANLNLDDEQTHEHPPLLSYVWLTGFGYGFARALVREGAPYSNPEPS